MRLTGDPALTRGTGYCLFPPAVTEGHNPRLSLSTGTFVLQAAAPVWRQPHLRL